MRFNGIGQVWNSDTNKLLCAFSDGGYDYNGKALEGFFDTNDVKVQNKLRALGYKSDEDIKIVKDKKDKEIKDKKDKEKKAKEDKEA